VTVERGILEVRVCQAGQLGGIRDGEITSGRTLMVGFREMRMIEKRIIERGIIERGIIERGIIERGIIERGIIERGIIERGIIER
jgi:hypothetical protein